MAESKVYSARERYRFANWLPRARRYARWLARIVVMMNKGDRFPRGAMHNLTLSMLDVIVMIEGSYTSLNEELEANRPVWLSLTPIVHWERCSNELGSVAAGVSHLLKVGTNGNDIRG